MRITRPFLALSLVLLAGPAFAQGGPGMHDSQAQTPQDRYEVVPNQQGQMPQSMTQKMQDMMQQRGMMQNMHPGMMQGMQSGSSGHMGQAGQFNPEIVSSATRGKIKDSLEQSGFKNVQVVPQAYLIRAEAPDGSRVVMQVNPEGLSGVVVEQPQGTGSSSTGSDSSTSSSSSSQQNR